MAKPFSVYDRGNGIFYAQFPISGGRYFQKSTGARTKTDAERVVLSWYVQGGVIPAHAGANTDNAGSKTTIAKRSFFAQLRNMEFSEDERSELLGILRERGFILSAVMPKTKASRALSDFLEEFWDYDRSPYVREKRLKGQSIHKDYCLMMGRRAKTYWLPRLENKELGSVTRDDVRKIFDDESIAALAPKTVNAIVSSITVPLKWAFYNGLTENNCFDGIIKCAAKSKKRAVLTMEQAAAVFKAEWGSESAKLANALAMYTGMRQGEIAALRVQDIGVDRLYVRHSWRPSEGVKCCKNGEEREVAIAPFLRDALIAQASLNPYGEGMDGFVFFGTKAGQPEVPFLWLRHLHRVLANIGVKNFKDICFHSWRHLWCSRVCDVINDRRVVMTGSGHKTRAMLDHYAAHIENENAIAQIGSAEERIFLPLLGGADRNRH